MRRIPLTRGLFAIVDNDDYHDLAQFSWRASPVSKTKPNKFRAQRSYVDPFGRSLVERMHVRITGFKMTDHINGNSLDNRRSNLREATPSDNRCNVAKSKGQSFYKGVSPTTSGKWRAGIRRDGVSLHLGTFDDELTAALAYDEAARNLHGRFARLNFPKPGEQSALVFG